MQAIVALIVAGAAVAFLGDPHAWRLIIAVPLFAAGAVAALRLARR